MIVSILKRKKILKTETHAQLFHLLYSMECIKIEFFLLLIKKSIRETLNNYFTENGSGTHRILMLSIDFRHSSYLSKLAPVRKRQEPIY
jgi:hypothetical protein